MGRPLLRKGDITDLPDRKLKEDSCRKYGVKVNGPYHIYPYYTESGELVAQKVRDTRTKGFEWYGDSSQATMFGQHLFKGGKRIVLTEGELDALSCFQVLGKNSDWPVVSIRNGAQDGDKAEKVANEVRKSFDFLNKFDEILLCFDNDSAGKNSARAVAALFPPGKVFIAQLRYKDPNEYLQKGKIKDLYSDLWNAPAWRPDGIVSAKDILVDLDIGEVLTFKSRLMTAKMLGRKIGTMTMLVSGTGSGKTTFVMDEMDEDVRRGVPVGGIFLEAQPRDTILDLAGLRMGKPVRRILTQRALLQIDPEIPCEYHDDLDDEELFGVVEEIRQCPIHLYDHFGSAKCSDVLKNIEYMVNGLGCQAIYLDHLSLIQTEGDDIKGLEQFVKDLQSLTKRLPAHFTIISQTTKGDGKKAHEEGGTMSTRDIRGSKMVTACMDDIIALQRDQQADTETERNTVNIYSLKGRLGATTGFIESRYYNKQTGRLEITDQPFVDETSVSQSEPNFLETLE